MGQSTENMIEEVPEFDSEYIRKIGINPILWEGFDYTELNVTRNMLAYAPIENMSYMVN